MNKHTILAELLYIIANYEKGRIRVDKIWSIKYVHSLCDSIDIMNYIVALMKSCNKIESVEINPVFDYINKYSGVFFQNDICEKIYDAYEMGIFFRCPKDDIQIELLQIMESILLECYALLIGKKKDYKKNIAYLLMALHNIPRALFEKKMGTYFNIGALPLNFEDVEKSVNSYMRFKTGDATLS